MQICYIKYEKHSANELLKRQAKKELYKIVDKKKRIVLATCIITIALNNINYIYASNLDIEKFKAGLDEKGNQLLSLIQAVGYWVAIVAAGIDVVKSIKKQDIAGIISIVMKYAVMFGLLHALPWFFELIKELFTLE